MEHDKGSGVLTLRILASDVKPRHSLLPIPLLADFKGEQFANSQSCVNAEYYGGAVTKGMPSFQAGEHEFQFQRR